LIEHTNEEWTSMLKSQGTERDTALTELRAVLVRGLGYALAKYPDVSQADIEDFCQDALLRIIDQLDTFRGESRFTTWAQKIAVHVAFTEMRRRRWRDASLDEMTRLSDGDLLPKRWADPAATVEQQTMRKEILDIMRRVIAQELTDKQRQAFVVVRLRGVPMEEAAKKLNMNRNALYKLLFDARQKLKQQMLARGLSPQDILKAFSS
jgi:RNA polymerase sigma-70 factor (ECF subfamily)